MGSDYASSEEDCLKGCMKPDNEADSWDESSEESSSEYGSYDERSELDNFENEEAISDKQFI